MKLTRWQITQVHVWMRKTFGFPPKCQHCGVKGEKKDGRWTIQFALRRGFEYEKKREAFLDLCVKCHATYDADAHKGRKQYGRLDIPMKERQKILHKKIRDLIKMGWSPEEVSRTFAISRTAIFYITKGRKKKLSS